MLNVSEIATNILERLKQEKAYRLEQLEQDHLVADTKIKADETTL